MSNVVIVRIDLDQYNIESLTEFVKTGVVSICEARTAHVVAALSEYEQLILVRKWQKIIQSPVRMVA